MYGKKIAALRKTQNMPQGQLAYEIGIARSSLSHYERSRREPDIATLIKIADYFKVTVDELVR